MIVGYHEDGPQPDFDGHERLGAAEPAWWLNLQANPEASSSWRVGSARVARQGAVGQERERQWQRWRELDQNLDGYAALRAQETAVVVLESRMSLLHAAT